MPFVKKTIQEVQDNMFERIGTSWMLVTAGTKENCNTMTASWGQVGILWNKPIATAYVRPQRYTKEFMDAQDYYSLSFFEKGKFRDELALLGTKSGRDGDKITEAGLSINEFVGVPAFEEASLVLICRKLYIQDMVKEGFLDSKIDETHYPQQDYHRMYIGEIEHTFCKV